MKIRLHGTREENGIFIDILKGIEKIHLLSVSNSYLDRGCSVLERRYIDLIFEDKLTVLQKIFCKCITDYNDRQSVLDFVESFELGARAKEIEGSLYYDYKDIQALVKGINKILR